MSHPRDIYTVLADYVSQIQGHASLSSEWDNNVCFESMVDTFAGRKTAFFKIYLT